MDDDADVKMILTVPPPPVNWKRPPGRPGITWLNTVQRRLTAKNRDQLRNPALGNRQRATFTF